MPYADPEDERRWREANRDWHKTPERRKAQKADRSKLRTEALKNLPDRYEYHYDNKKKSSMKWTWIKQKKNGLLASDFERTWSAYVEAETCEVCNISLKKVKKNMDHCHKSGYMRFIVCQRCNGFLRYRDGQLDEVLSSLR